MKLSATHSEGSGGAINAQSAKDAAAGAAPGGGGNHSGCGDCGCR
jgi:hypothetical protein